MPRLVMPRSCGAAKPHLWWGPYSRVGGSGGPLDRCSTLLAQSSFLLHDCLSGSRRISCVPSQKPLCPSGSSGKTGGSAPVGGMPCILGMAVGPLASLAWGRLPPPSMEAAWGLWPSGVQSPRWQGSWGPSMGPGVSHGAPHRTPLQRWPQPLPLCLSACGCPHSALRSAWRSSAAWTGI